MNPFRITCTTCHARIKIVDPSAIGDIIACPKCQSMVQATPPEGWSPDGPATADSVVLGSSAVVGAGGASAGAKPKAASAAKAVARRAVPPPLPNAQSLVPPTTSPASEIALDLPSAAAPSARWFWPALTSATMLSLGIAAWVIYLNQKNQAEQAVASATTTSATSPQLAVNVAQPKPSGTNQAAKNDEAAAKPVIAPEKPAVVEVPAAKTEPKHEEPPEPVVQAAPAKVPSVVAAENTIPPAAVKPAVDPSQQAAGKAEPPAPSPVTPPVEVPPPAAVPPIVAAQEKPEPDPARAADPAIKRPAPPSVEKIPPRTVDVETHLTDPLAAVNFRDAPLIQFLGEVSQWSTIPISLDADALSELNVSPIAPITIRLTGTTIGGVLDEALSPLGLTYYTVGHQLVIGRPKQGQLRRARYSVSDLSGDSPASKAQFESLMHAMIEPSGWKEAGGAATSQWGEDKLIIEAGESAHTQLLIFCEKLRVARGLPLRSRIDPARFALTPRSAAAQRILAQPVTANYGRPEPLGRVLAYLQSVAKVNLLVDHAALSDQRTSIDTQGILLADRQPLGQTMTALLEPMELTWRVVGERTIEITTPQAAARRGEVEFYPATELLTGTTGDGLATRLERELTASTPADQPAIKPTIRFDAPSRMLIVRAPQSLQNRVAALLSGWRVAKQ